MITLILPNGKQTVLTNPTAGKPSFPWMEQALGIPSGYLEFVRVALPGSAIGAIKQANLVVHEEGRWKGLEFNPIASEYYWTLIKLRSPNITLDQLMESPIVGPALLLTGKDRIK